MPNLARLLARFTTPTASAVVVELTAHVVADSEAYVGRRTVRWPSVPNVGDAVAVCELRAVPIGSLPVVKVRYRSNGIAMVSLGEEGGSNTTTDVLEMMKDQGWFVDALTVPERPAHPDQ